MSPRPLSAVTAPILARLYADRIAATDAAEAELRRLSDQNDALTRSLGETVDRLQPSGKEKA